MQHHHDSQSVTSRLVYLLDELSAGCDAEFDAAYDDLEREFAELRCQPGNA
jgi:hypothetical protein